MQAGDKMKQIYIFIGDYKALALAIADQEKTRPYLTLETVPVLVPHAHMWLGHRDIHVPWTPGHAIPQNTDFP